MKLATYLDGSRDGQLLVVSRDLHSAHFAAGIATRMQQLLDDWNFVSPQLHDLYHTLNQGKARHAVPFEPARCMAPLPRAYQWIVGAADTDGAALPGRARAPAAPGEGLAQPMAGLRLVQRGSDPLLGAHDAAGAQGAAAAALRSSVRARRFKAVARPRRTWPSASGCASRPGPTRAKAPSAPSTSAWPPCAKKAEALRRPRCRRTIAARHPTSEGAT